MVRSLAVHSFTWLVMCIGLGGCDGGPKAIRPPDWDPDGLAANVMSLLDTSRDDNIDKSEAVAAPSILATFARLDRNGDGRLSRDEVRNRFAFYKEYRNGLMNQTFEVRLNGRPAVGTRVDLVPEPFLEDVIKPASGVVDSLGFVSPTLEDAEFPGMQVGLYQSVIYDKQDSTEPIAGIAPIGVEASPLGTRDSSAVLDFRKR